MASRTPTLTWSDANAGLFYYETQVSKDRDFGTGAFLYWTLLHDGVTTPANSYVIPAAFPLENSTTYYWRVRPRCRATALRCRGRWLTVFAPPRLAPPRRRPGR